MSERLKERIASIIGDTTGDTAVADRPVEVFRLDYPEDIHYDFQMGKNTQDILAVNPILGRYIRIHLTLASDVDTMSKLHITYGNVGQACRLPSITNFRNRRSALNEANSFLSERRSRGFRIYSVTRDNNVVYHASKERT